MKSEEAIKILRNQGYITVKIKPIKGDGTYIGDGREIECTLTRKGELRFLDIEDAFQSVDETFHIDQRDKKRTTMLR